MAAIWTANEPIDNVGTQPDEPHDKLEGYFGR